MIFLGEGRVRSSISTATRSFSVTNSDNGPVPMGFCRTVRVLSRILSTPGESAKSAKDKIFQAGGTVRGVFRFW